MIREFAIRAVVLFGVPALALGDMLELLEQALARGGEPVERRLTGHFAESVVGVTEGRTVVGRARLAEELDEPGCGRLVLTILADGPDGELVELAEANLDMCEGGVPPDPSR